MEAGLRAWDGKSFLSTGQLDPSEDNASMQESNSITPSSAHDWHLSHRCFVPACLVRKPRDAPFNAARLLMTIVPWRVLLATKEQGEPDQPDRPDGPDQPLARGSTEHCIFRTRNTGHARAIFMAGPSPSCLRSLFPGTSAGNSPDDQPPGAQWLYHRGERP